MMTGLSRDTRRSMRRARRKRGTELNIVSMIDILTVLVFFLLVNSIGVSILGINLPDTNAKPATPPPHSLAVVVRQTGLTVTDLGSQLESLPVGGDGYDLKSLHELLLKVKDRIPEEDKIAILLEPGISYEVLVEVMDAVRNDTSSGKLTRALFPAISLGDAPATASAAPAAAAAPQGGKS
jgi:biopolymer transport protein ExbD